MGAGVSSGGIIVVGAGAAGASMLIGIDTGDSTCVISSEEGEAASMINARGGAAGEASMTLGLGLGLARPTPINAKLLSSTSSGQGLSVYSETVFLTEKKATIAHAKRAPRPIDETDWMNPIITFCLD